MVSSGFSIRSTTTADMRMGDGCDQDAISLIATSNKEDLVAGLRRYGEVSHAGRIADALQRAVAEGRTSGEELADAVRGVLRGHFNRRPAIPVFQALRIMVNDELGQLDRLLVALPQLLRPQHGKVAIITFHSLEGRMVKRAFRHYASNGCFQSVTRQPILPSEDEQLNNRARFQLSCAGLKRRQHHQLSLQFLNKKMSPRDLVRVGSKAMKV